MSPPAVSVVIPSYNHGRFIARAVDSVLSSSFTDLELLIVDDGSSDDTLQVLRPYRAHRQVTIRTQENRGAHAALNLGLSLARGRLLFVLNSDDAYHPERIQRLVERFRDDPAIVLAASWIEVVDAEDRSLGVKRGHLNMPPWPPASAGPLLSALGEPELALLETNFISTTSNIAFRRSLLDEAGLDFLPLRYTHDWEFILAACRHGRLALVEEPLVFYRVHGSNTIREGAAQAAGEMRFEVMWTVCRHARATCGDAAARGHHEHDLVRRMWRSLPRFGCEGLLAELLAVRGLDAVPPASYDALLEPGHPFRRAAVAALAAMP
ncbi:MAG TPA: glycosyltransferase [Thermoanaerobaculales bacterium]|nr:glycosyltransferase [Thermoanaerobaculales bacterium]HPA81965.1 glycosyltransferase [Thermoanaerobaculales bacterium]HQL29945.1 glycosyltransferase [Thermoanaerobaculales bacterium]HQN94903.1 glycosyltransferase [Thermoanaerobaculales bacterium]HQP42580.1 glycosyltransferase [Thermoanaerobaculales bacterium]